MVIPEKSPDGKTVTSIEALAFYGCTKLTDILYNGTKAQWNKY